MYLVTMRLADGRIAANLYATIRAAQMDAAKHGANIQSVQKTDCAAARGLDL
jgi:hypothetical protein